jgi:hypothetical protein
MYSETYASNSLDTSTKRIQLLILSPIKDVHISTIKSKHLECYFEDVIQYIQYFNMYQQVSHFQLE